MKMTFQEIRIIATGPCITNQSKRTSFHLNSLNTHTHTHTHTRIYAVGNPGPGEGQRGLNLIMVAHSHCVNIFIFGKACGLLSWRENMHFVIISKYLYGQWLSSYQVEMIRLPLTSLNPPQCRVCLRPGTSFIQTSCLFFIRLLSIITD